MDEHHPGAVRTILRWLKEGPPGAIPLGAGWGRAALQAVTWEDAGDHSALDALARWQARSPDPFPPTREAARRWLAEHALAPDRVLFWVRDGAGAALGHLGLACFDPAEGSALVVDVLRGESGLPGVMGAALESLGGWALEALRLRAVRLWVSPGDGPALGLCRRGGFTPAPPGGGPLWCWERRAGPAAAA